jgi:muramoyltetrapeptide carboxypeptidase
MSDMHDNKIPFGFNAEEIIAASMHDVDSPLVFGFSAGHIQENLPIYLGREAILESKLHEVVLRYE